MRDKGGRKCSGAVVMSLRVTSHPSVIGILSDERVRGQMFKEFNFDEEYFMMQCLLLRANSVISIEFGTFKPKGKIVFLPKRYIWAITLFSSHFLHSFLSLLIRTFFLSSLSLIHATHSLISHPHQIHEPNLSKLTCKLRKLISATWYL